jgi:hypothetical protein
MITSKLAEPMSAPTLPKPAHTPKQVDLTAVGKISVGRVYLIKEAIRGTQMALKGYAWPSRGYQEAIKRPSGAISRNRNQRTSRR